MRQGQGAHIPSSEDQKYPQENVRQPQKVTSCYFEGHVKKRPHFLVHSVLFFYCFLFLAFLNLSIRSLKFLFQIISISAHQFTKPFTCIKEIMLT